jgi:hypothetical protein
MARCRELRKGSRERGGGVSVNIPVMDAISLIPPLAEDQSFLYAPSSRLQNVECRLQRVEGFTTSPFANLRSAFCIQRFVPCCGNLGGESPSPFLPHARPFPPKKGEPLSYAAVTKGEAQHRNWPFCLAVIPRKAGAGWYPWPRICHLFQDTGGCSAGRGSLFSTWRSEQSDPPPGQCSAVRSNRT